MKPLSLALAIGLCLAGSSWTADAARPGPAGELIAIDVLIQPDQRMISAAQALNARLRADDPAGYRLDAAHAPHVTLLQRFVRRKDFEAVTAAVAKVVASERPAGLEMRATGVDYAMWSGSAVTALTVERTPALVRLHRRVIDAVGPYSVTDGTAAAFVGGAVNPETVGWVASFVPKSSGARFAPHVTAGVASEAFARKLKAEPFRKVAFKARGVAIYQLGNFGTAATKLWPK